jgi:hypothetical protein
MRRRAPKPVASSSVGGAALLVGKVIEDLAELFGNAVNVSEHGRVRGVGFVPFLELVHHPAELREPGNGRVAAG